MIYKVLLNIFLFLMLNSLLVYAQNAVPVVENVTFSQRTDGTYLVDIFYNVYDADGNSVTITMKASNDEGISWNYSCNNTTGDIGPGISSGTNSVTKHIIWDFAAEHPDTCCDKFQIKIIADDEVKGCSGLETVTYAGEIYNTVEIGDQCWLRENINVGTMIYSGVDNPSNNGIIEKYCIGNDTDCGRSYGRRPGGYYRWDEAMQYATGERAQGICPDGWHIPTLSEFQTLAASVDLNADRLIQMDESGHPWSPEVNSSGFSALIHGYHVSYYNVTYERCTSYGSFESQDIYGFFWTSSKSDGEQMDAILLGKNDVINYMNYALKIGGCLDFSVRCIKD